MSHDDDQSAAKMCDGVFDAGQGSLIDHVASAPHHEEITESSSEKEFWRCATISATDDDRIRVLPGCEIANARLGHVSLSRSASRKCRISGYQPLEGCLRLLAGIGSGEMRRCRCRFYCGGSRRLTFQLSEPRLQTLYVAT
jgi:hypothetical protein